jgi:hypothetical protein
MAIDYPHSTQTSGYAVAYEVERPPERPQPTFAIEGARMVSMAAGGAAIGSLFNSLTGTILGAVVGAAFAVVLWLLDLRRAIASDF